MARGVLAYGGYIPLRRLSRASIAQANGWFNSGLKSRAKGERAMANWDEDSVTMAVAAARDCLGERDRGDIAALHFASTSFPFLDRLNAGIVAGALNLKSDVGAHDHAATQRAGTSALSLAMEAAGAGPQLVIAALLKDASIAPAGVSAFCMPCTLPRVVSSLAKKAGLRDESVQDNMNATCGETGAAHPLLMLARALETAKPGDLILVAGFGQGSDVLAVRATDRVAGFKPKLGVAGHLARR